MALISAIGSAGGNGAYVFTSVMSWGAAVTFDLTSIPNYQSLTVADNIKVGMASYTSRSTGTSSDPYTISLTANYNSSTGVLTVSKAGSAASADISSISCLAIVSPNGFTT